MPTLKYKDLEVAIIGDRDYGPWSTWATYGLARASGTFKLRMGREKFRTIVRKLDSGDIDGSELRNLGKEMFESLFQDQVGSLYNRAEAALSDHLGFRILLNIESAILNRLPWEFLYDQKFLAIYCKTPIERKIPVARITKENKSKNKLRILVVISSPKDEVPLNVQREVRFIKSELGELERSGSIELTILNHATPDELERTLRSPFDVFHFIGHAGFEKSRQKGLIVLQDRKGYSKYYDGEVLGAVLEGADVRMAILNACETAKSAEHGYMLGVGHSVLSAGIPNVVAMQFTIPDKTAILFAKRFYYEMAFGEYVDTALTRARQSIGGDTGVDKKDWGIPVLFTTDPENLILLPKSRISSIPQQKKQQFSRQTKVVGICDINSLLINLESITKNMNSSQRYFHFVVIPGFYSVEMFTKHRNGIVCHSPRAFPQLSLLFKKYKKLFRLDVIMGITQNMISDGELHDLFADTDPRNGVALISTYELEEFAGKAGKTLEQAVMHQILGGLVVLYGNIGYHEETRTCLMDYCDNREDIVKSLRQPRLDDSCRAGINDPSLLAALDKLLGNI